jgi:hypothetical protein
VPRGTPPFRRRCSLVGFLAGAAHAAQVALAADTHVSSARPTTNFGTVANLYVGGGNTSLLLFCLTTLPTGVTSSQIAHATLTVYGNRVNTAGTISVAPVTSAWTESSVTYSSAPAMGTARHVAFRVLDIGYLHTGLGNGGSNSQDTLRIGAGVVFRFGS